MSCIIPESQDDIKVPSIELHIWRRTIEGKRRDLAAVFEFSVVSDKLTSLVDVVRWPKEAYIPPCNCGECDYKQSVLVNIVEVSQESKQREEYFVRSIVGLHGLNGRSHWLAQGFKSPPVALPELFTRVAYGEHKLSLVRRDFLSRFANGDCINIMIERTPQIMHDIAGNERPFMERGFFFNSKDNTIPGKVSIRMVDKTIRVIIHPGFDLILEGVEVFLGMSNPC